MIDGCVDADGSGRSNSPGNYGKRVHRPASGSHRFVLHRNPRVELRGASGRIWALCANDDDDITHLGTGHVLRIVDGDAKDSETNPGLSWAGR